MDRAVLTFAASASGAEGAQGLGRSLKLIGDETRRVLLTNQNDRPWNRCFDEVLPLRSESSAGLWTVIADILGRGENEVLFLAPWSLAFRRVGPIFDAFAANDIALLLCAGNLPRDARQVDGRFFYLRAGEVTGSILAECRDCAAAASNERLPTERSLGQALESASRKIGGRVRICPDQEYFVDLNPVPGSLRMDVRTNTCQFVSRSPEPRLRRPYIVPRPGGPCGPYMTQLHRLAKLAAYEAGHPPGYVATPLKFRRSVEKRILRVMGKR